MLYIVLLLIISLIILVFIAHNNTFKLQITHTQIDLKQANQSLNINILHLSDLHMEHISIAAEDLYQKLVNKKIDLIALTGDYLERVKNIDKFIKYLTFLNKLKPQYGIYLVFGNHDYLLKNKLPLLQKRIEELGIKVLKNENETIKINGQKVHIIGIDNFSTKHHDIHKSFANIIDGIKIVLTHDPNIVLDMREYSFDYLLSGHFHGGQIHWPKPYHLIKMGKLARMKVIKGLHYINGMPIYINEGLGQTGVNIRLRSRPEVTIHKLSV